MIAACAQTISGFGMNLILAPAAQLLLPGAAAVRLVVGTGAILNSGLLAAGQRSVLWRPALYLAGPALAVTILLGPVIPGASSRLVSVTVAAVTILAVAVSARAALPPRLNGPAGALLAGALSGALNISSGISGPPVAVYAAAQPWPPRQLVATVQAVFLPLNIAAFIVLHHAPVPAGMFGAGTAGTGAGLLAGTFLQDRVPPGLVRIAVLIIAGAGAGTVLVRLLV
jgi:uncharacterized membrane protein YfcA